VQLRRLWLTGSCGLDILVQQLDNFLASVKAHVRQQHPSIPGDWDLDFHVYGKGQSTPAGPGEVFIIVEAVAPTQQLATCLVSTARVALIVSIAVKVKLGGVANKEYSMDPTRGRRRLRATLPLALPGSWRSRQGLVLSFPCTI
jgi:hypothetical protein